MPAAPEMSSTEWRSTRRRGERLPRSVHPVFSAEWLLERATVNPITECWEWKLWRNQHGYGRWRTVASGLYAHRAAWAYAFGDIPDGMCVLHRCDNPPCVNPAHLFLGTMADNSADMVHKLRHGRMKVRPEDVYAIRASPLGCRRLAKQYGISRHTVLLIKQRKTWQWLAERPTP